MEATFDFERFPRIETSRLLLRNLRKEDAPALFNLLSDSAVMQYTDMEPLVRLDQAYTLIERFRLGFEYKQRFRWGIALKENNSIIGTGGYVSWNRRWHLAEIGYELAHPYWKQGLMSEALESMLQFGFEQMALHRVEAEVLPENTASLRLLSKLGFQQEGVLRERGFWKGAFHDVVMLARLNS